MVYHGYSEVVSIKVPFSIKKLIRDFKIQPRQILIKGLNASSSDADVFLTDFHDAVISTRVTPTFKNKLKKSHVPLRNILIRGLVELVGSRAVCVALMQHDVKLLRKYQEYVNFYQSEINMLREILREEHKKVNNNGLHFNGKLVKTNMC